MAQTNFTPIQLYFSSTTTNVPLAANLANGELAINITDGKLFYKDNANAVQVIGWKIVPATAGGTGQTSYAVGDLLYADTTTTLAKLPDIATGNALLSGGVGVAPSWGKIGLTTHVSGVLPVANGGTGNATGAATAVTSNSTSGLLQITGPAAASTRVMTTPNANFTAARTDAAQTFTGDQSITDKVYVGGATAYSGSQVIVGSGRIQSNNNTYGFVGPYGITSINSGASGTVSQSGGGLTLVQGGISFNNFWDLVIWQYAGNAVTISSAVYGSPSSRSYSVSSGNLVLAITNNNNTGNYGISVTNIGS